MWLAVLSTLLAMTPSIRGTPRDDYWGEDRATVGRTWEVLLPLLAKQPELGEQLWRQLAVDEPDRLIERFLIANRHDLCNTVKAVLDNLQWRRDNHLNELAYGSGEQTIKEHLFESGKGMFWGHDREGYLVIQLAARAHDKYAQSLPETVAHIIYQTELGRRLFLPGRDRVTVLFDLAGMGSRALDYACIRFTLDCLQKHYPESLVRALIVNAPWGFATVWAVVRPLVGLVVQAKIEFVDAQTICDYIDPMYIPRRLGGQSDYVYQYFPPSPISTPDEPARTTEVAVAEKERGALIERLYATRDTSLLERLKDVERTLDRHRYPGNLYTRTGVIGPDGSIDWKRYREPTAIE